MVVHKKSAQKNEPVAPQGHSLLCDLKGPRGLHASASRSGLSARESVERAYRFADDLARDLAPDLLRCETQKTLEAKLLAAKREVLELCTRVLKDSVPKAETSQATDSLGDATKESEKPSGS